MRLDQQLLQPHQRLSTAPHQYAHDLLVPASYVVVKPHKGHSTTFRVRSGYSVAEALSECRRRMFKPLYVVHTKLPRRA